MAAYHCCVPFCTSDSRYNAGKNISFHRIPAFHTEPERHQEWLARIRRDPGPYFKISTCTRVCSKHFLPSDFIRTLTGKRNLMPECVPSVFQWSEDTPMQPQPSKRKSLGSSKNTLKSIQPVQQTQIQRSESTPELQHTSSFLDHCYDIPPTSESEMLEAAREEIARLQQHTALIEGKLFFLERFSNDSCMIYFYTGFKDYATLKDFFVSLKPTSVNTMLWAQCQQDADNSVGKVDVSSEETLSPIDQFFLFLCKVRQGFFEEDLAVRFNVSQATVIKIIITWANYLYIMFKVFLSWPSRENIDKDMPAIFQATYPQARVILSCIELKVQTCCLYPLSGTYSVQNRYTIFKGLLGLAPHGDVIFKSPLYSSTTSEKEITRLSGILELIEPNDVVIADASFAVQDLLESVGAHLVEYPFLCPSAQEMEEMDEEVVAVGDLELDEVMVKGPISMEEHVVSVGEESVLVEELPAAIGGELHAAVGAESPETVGEESPEAVGGESPAAVRGESPAAVGGEPPAAVGGELPAAVGGELPAAVGGELPAAVGGELPAAVGGELPAAVEGELPAAVGGEFPAAVGEELPATVGEELSASVEEEEPSAVEETVPDEVGEQAPDAIREEELTTQDLEEAPFVSYALLETNRITCLTSHVEEVVGRIKEYRIFDTVIPVTLASTVHQLWAVCVVLNKFSGSQS